ncbi:MAG: hypothetical protein GY717_17185 [Rhodobacteraceae bacterium]|nr:hypothetical protein [Paracoccaceae bacterium]
MTYESLGHPALDYFQCRYGTSKMLFRGPRRQLHDDYIAFLGGIETYGKFIELPFPALTEHDTGVKSVNLGRANVGIDAYLGDDSLVGICAGARVTVIQIMGAQNMSNRYYAVHSRRNDRFLRASKMLGSLYPEIDFTDFSFTRHMLATLAGTSQEKFKVVEQELKDAWVARMQSLIQLIGGKVVLLWLANHAPGAPDTRSEPLLIDRMMIDSLSGIATDVIEVVARPEERREGFAELVFGPLEEPAAEEMLGPVVHRRVASELASCIRAHV